MSSAGLILDLPELVVERVDRNDVVEIYKCDITPRYVLNSAFNASLVREKSSS